MVEQPILLITLGMALVTFLPRFLPALLLRNRTLPHWLERWLSYVPIAVFSALLLPSLLLVDGKLAVEPSNGQLWVALPVLAFAILTRQFGGTILVGMGCMALWRWMGF